MVALPKGWRVHHRRDPEVELRRLRRRFERVSRRAERRTRRRRWFRLARLAALAGVAGAGAYLAVASVSPWPVDVTLRHLAAAPNCAAARAVDLAPSLRGAPGYWPTHDRDDDGVACEPWPRS